MHFLASCLFLLRVDCYCSSGKVAFKGASARLPPRGRRQPVRYLNSLTPFCRACACADNTWQVDFDSDCKAEAKMLGRTWKLLQ